MSRPLLLALCLAVAACGATAPRPTEPPGVEASRPLPAPVAERTLANGLRVLRLPARAGALEATLVVSAGPLDDPAALPGLTEWSVGSALLATLNDPDEDTPPERRALLAGGEIVGIADGRVAGWLVAGPAASSDALLAVLIDTVLAASVPATRQQLRASVAREQIEARGGADIDQAIGLGLGLAIGLGRPVALGPTVEMLERVNREDVVRHLARLLRPERAVLVVAAPDGVDLAPILARLSEAWPAAPAPGSSAGACLPRGQSRHLLFSAEAPRTRAVALLAVPVPGPGAAGRAAVDVLVGVLGERPLGPVEQLLGSEQARRARPQVIDLGLAGGRAVSVLLSGTAGEPADALADLEAVAALLSEQAGDAGPDGDAIGGGVRAREAVRVAARARPAGRVVTVATEALYGVDPTAGVDAAALQEAARRWLPPWRHTLVAWGGASAEAALGRAGSVTVWDPSGRKLRGPAPADCLPEGGATAP